MSCSNFEASSIRRYAENMKHRFVFKIKNRSSHRRCSVKKCSYRFRNIYRKTPVFESLLNKVAGFHACGVFWWILRTRILRNICEQLLLKKYSFSILEGFVDSNKRDDVCELLSYWNEAYSAIFFDIISDQNQIFS